MPLSFEEKSLQDLIHRECKIPSLVKNKKGNIYIYIYKSTLHIIFYEQHIYQNSLIKSRKGEKVNASFSRKYLINSMNMKWIIKIET